MYFRHSKKQKIYMRKILLIALFFAATISVKAQEGLRWYDDINQAIEVSRQEQKPLFLFSLSVDGINLYLSGLALFIKTSE